MARTPDAVRPERTTCALCKIPKPLQRSHIIPEFCYKPLYDNIHRAHLLDRRHTAGKARFIQKGEREPLLCFDCEQFLNDNFEKPFLADWMEAAAIPNPMHDRAVMHRVPDYARFKLFHMSVLWRAGVATDETWENITIPPRHEERLRTMLLARDPGREEDYPIICFGSVDHENRPLLDLISQPTDNKVFSMNAFQFIFGGATWHYVCSSHYDRQAACLHLKADGTLPIARDNIFENPNVAEIAGAELKRLGIL